MSSDEIRLWRDSLGSFVRDSVFGAATHIAVPAAKHAALMRVVEAARAFDAADAAVRAKQDEADLDLLRRCEPEWFANRDALKSAIAALEAAAAKEVA